MKRCLALVLAGCTGIEDPPATSAPDVQFVELSDGDIVPAGAELSLRATASDADHRGPELSSIWALDGVPTCDDDSLAADGTTSCSLVFVEGDHTVSVQVTDPDGLSSSTEATLIATFENRSPVVSSVTITPENPTLQSSLFCDPTATDPDGDPLTYTRLWTVNNEGISGNLTTLSDVFTKGDTINCTVTAFDGELSSPPITSPLVVIENAAPSAPEIGILPLEPNEHEIDLTCFLSGESIDPDGDVVSYEFSWSVDETPFLGTTTQSHPGDTVPSEELDQGEHWQCSVAASDGDQGESIATSTVIIVP